MLRASIGNRVAKELMCMTHGHEQRRGNHQREWRVQGGGEQRGKNWDNCRTAIKYLLKNKNISSFKEKKRRMLIHSLAALCVVSHLKQQPRKTNSALQRGTAPPLLLRWRRCPTRNVWSLVLHPRWSRFSVPRLSPSLGSSFLFLPK